MCTVTVATTAGRPDAQSEQLAREVCMALGTDYVPRQKLSVPALSEKYDAHVIVAGKNRLAYYAKGATVPFFFHPNSAAFRLKRIARGESEPLLDACRLKEGERFLDCTLGIAADSIVASYVVGATGQVVGLEIDRNIAYIVGQGLQHYDTSKLPLTACMRRIEVVCASAVDFLRKQPSDSFDIVYMDPMFEEVIEEANNFEALRHAGAHMIVSREWVEEALRVAKKRVVLKAHYKSPLFDQYGFTRFARQTAKFHYGVMEKACE